MQYYRARKGSPGVMATLATLDARDRLDPKALLDPLANAVESEVKDAQVEMAFKDKRESLALQVCNLLCNY